MNTDEETLVVKTDASDPTKEASGTSNSGNENYVVLDMAEGDSEDSDKEGGGKESLEKPPKPPSSDVGAAKPQSAESETKPVITAAPRMRKKPKAPVVDVDSLRKRKWQLKVYPLHADDLKLSYVSILCKLASESLLYIPSESRHGKAELYVAIQKEMAAIIGKLLRMGFYHPLLSIEVVRKDTGGKGDGDDSKKECKAFLMFDKYMSKKIFDAKGKKGKVIERTVTLNKLPKAATKDFIEALFPFATEIEIIESDSPGERKANVICKTPVTALLVYKSFKRLEINDVHVKLTVVDAVKNIRLPHAFFVAPPEIKDSGPMEHSGSSFNQSSMLPLNKRPLMSSLNRRAQLIKKRALLTRKKPTRGQMMRAQRMGPGDDMMEDMMGGRNSMTRRGVGGPDPSKVRLIGGREPGGINRRRMMMMDRPGDRQRDRESMERVRRRNTREDSQMTKEMLQLQSQLNQAIKNQIAMLSTSQGGGPLRGSAGGIQDSTFGISRSSATSSLHRSSLLGQGPGRHFGGGGDAGLGMGGRGLDQADFSSWAMDRGHRGDRGANERGGRPDRTDHSSRIGSRDRMDRGNRNRGGTDRPDRGAGGQLGRSGQRPSAFSGVSGDSRPLSSKGERTRGGNLANNHGVESSRGSGRPGRGGPDYSSSGRSSQRNENAYSGQGTGSGRYSDYSSQSQGENGSFYRRY